MELEIEDYLIEKYHNRLKLEVEFEDFRKYKIIITFPEAVAIIKFTYDNKFTFENNMINLIKYVDEQIIKYYKGGDDNV